MLCIGKIKEWFCQLCTLIYEDVLTRYILTLPLILVVVLSGFALVQLIRVLTLAIDFEEKSEKSTLKN